jgi:hypothetical protein
LQRNGVETLIIADGVALKQRFDLIGGRHGQCYSLRSFIARPIF